MRAQVSVEFLVIMGMILVLMIPVIIYAFSIINIESQEKIDISKAKVSVDRLAYTVDSVGSAGTGSILYTEIFVSRVDNVTIHPEGEIEFGIETSNGNLDIYKKTQYKLTFDPNMQNIKSGNYKVLISATNSSHVFLGLA